MAVTCILKKASHKGFSCLYTNLSDIVTVMTSASGEDKFNARRELNLVDFLVIDEFDSRFMPSENAADLYARSLESVFRSRSQNKLPTLMCTNSPNVVESFHGPLKASVDSLMQGYLKVFPVFGTDYRKNKQ
jgi:DNA replication protein DnaC